MEKITARVFPEKGKKVATSVKIRDNEYGGRIWKET
jgi:hypothetical protein